MIEDIGADKSEIIDAIHAGANQSEIARLERAIWRLFDRASGIDRLIRERDALLAKQDLSYAHGFRAGWNAGATYENCQAVEWPRKAHGDPEKYIKQLAAMDQRISDAREAAKENVARGRGNRMAVRRSGEDAEAQEGVGADRPTESRVSASSPKRRKPANYISPLSKNHPSYRKQKFGRK